MLNVHTDNIGDVAVLACEGRIVGSGDAFRLRSAVSAQASSRLVVMDLTEVSGIASDGVGMLMFLQRWARDHNIRLRLFDPRQLVRDVLEEPASREELGIAPLHEIMALADRNDLRCAKAA